MGKFWSKEPTRSRIKDRDACTKNAHSLHDFYCVEIKSFPQFWSLIDFDKEKLANIFEFFCETRAIQQVDGTTLVVELLGKRLEARWTGNEVVPSADLRGIIGSLSRSLIATFGPLEEKGLIVAAFELFASGSLSITRPQHMTSLTKKCNGSSPVPADFDTDDPEPDSGGFFYWAEFALLAANLGFDTESWIRILPVLLRAEIVFALCYGKPQNGVIPPSRKFQDYASLDFTKLHPNESSLIVQTSSTSLGELELEATECARFAFPGEFEPK